MISTTLKKLKLISGSTLAKIFDDLYNDILTIPYTSASTFIKKLWERYNPASPSTNGSVFEGLIATVLYKSKILPLYLQAEISFVPNVKFDFVAYAKTCGPIVLAAKTSLRERYKQADLEGMMLRQVHRKAKRFLITLNEEEARNVNKKIKQGKVLGLDRVVVMDYSFDDLICELQNHEYIIPNKIPVIKSQRLVTL
ncbi:MAG: hypothetical protein ACPGC9_00645 [Cytophagales bacterium]